jgi:hypothetical protein
MHTEVLAVMADFMFTTVRPLPCAEPSTGKVQVFLCWTWMRLYFVGQDWFERSFVDEFVVYRVLICVRVTSIFW